MTDLEKLPADGFTLDQAMSILGWTLSSRALAHQLRGIGFQSRRASTTDGRSSRVHWYKPEPVTPVCTCRCHTRTCGENAMVLAERTLRLIEKLRPISADMVMEIERIVDAAGVDFAREAMLLTNDEVPF